MGHFLWSGLCSKCRENPAFFAYFTGQGGQNFSAVETAWRREVDSNFEYGFTWSRYKPLPPLT